ncbi:alpha/beta fold hydrolase [Flavobacterium oreochromis]|uniref:alpha/beta fold hydrolase n=1 Tax=Flavobacterium oreochromis TaxID=2906078 RepID=UPI00385BB4CD
MNDCYQIDLFNFKLSSEKILPFLPLLYQSFGQKIGTAPVVLINHALTGNSNVAGEAGWWKQLVGFNQTIDLNAFSVIAFNILGNGYNGSPLVDNYQDFTTQDVARIFWEGLFTLGINELFAVVGGSLGGGIAWEMAFLQPKAIQFLIPIASNWKANDWLIANVLVQENILKNSSSPIEDARAHAMLLYRTPESLNQKFENAKVSEDEYKVENWLNYHGKTLKKRFQLKSYLLMNHLLKTIGENLSMQDMETFLETTTAQICQVCIDSDYLFTANDNRELHNKFSKQYKKMQLFEMQSIHGHDAFLMEYEQLNTILKSIFTNTTKEIELCKS